MAQVKNSEDRFGGQYMIQDRDHMSEIDQTTDKANRGEVRQADQSHESGRQQGDGDSSSNKQQGKRQRQAY